MKMKAAIRREYCPVGEVRVEHVEKPTPKSNEILVRVHATTVNRTDCGVLTGKPHIIRLFTGLTRPKLPIPGTDFAGTIEAIGKDVTNFAVGERLCGFHDEGLASQAEYLSIGVDKAIMRIPSKQSFAEAVASLEAAHYAYNFIRTVGVETGQRVMLNGATGAIGSAALQFLKAKDIEVTAVCATPHLERIRALGADEVIDYLTHDFTQDASRHGTYDHVLDAVGKSTFGKCKLLLKERGSYSSSEFGPKIQNPFLAIMTMRSKQRVHFPLPVNIKRSMEHVKDLVERGKFTPLIDRTYTLDDIAQAYTYVASGQKIGNVILNMEDV